MIEGDAKFAWNLAFLELLWGIWRKCHVLPFSLLWDKVFSWLLCDLPLNGASGGISVCHAI